MVAIEGSGVLKQRGGRRNSRQTEIQPLFSLITVVLNGAAHLENTIQSIVDQTFKDYEYIIIDGGSTDGTLEILRKYDCYIDYWVSEPDQGISDAFNKAYRVSRGNYLNFQGDGDGFVSPHVLTDVARSLDGSWLFAGRIHRIDKDGHRCFSSPLLKANYRYSLLTRMPFPHQGLFMARPYFEKYGLFDTTLSFSMDYELLLRSYASPVGVCVTDQVIANWRDDGLGSDRLNEVFLEYLAIRRRWITLPLWCIQAVSFLARFKYFIQRGQL